MNPHKCLEISMNELHRSFVPPAQIVAHKANGHPIFKLLVGIKFFCPNGYIIYIPAGFLFDGASIPKFAWSIVGTPGGRYLFAALIHDWLYMSRAFKRKDADKLFLRIMERLEIGCFGRHVMYNAVRAFGHDAFFESDERPYIKRLYKLDSTHSPFSPHKMRITGVICDIFDDPDNVWKMDDKEFYSKMIWYIKHDR